MIKSLTGAPAAAARGVGGIAIVYAGDYVNKLSGERVERECRNQLEAGCRALVVSFRNTELVNSIGISILLGVIDLAEQSGVRLIFACVNRHTYELFELLGLTRHVALADSEEDALSTLSEFNVSAPQPPGH
jgi:anti-anti-sigma factor